NNSGGGALGGADSNTDNSGVKVNPSPKTAIQSNGSSGGDDAINENNPIMLDEVVITTTVNHNQLEVSDAGWFLSTTIEGIKRNSEYNAKYYIAKYGTRDFSAEEITRQTRSQMGRYARNAKWGGIIVTGVVGGLDILDGYQQDGGKVGKNTKAAAARTGGGAAGAIVGGKIGTIAGGFICGPPCALAGGIIGAAYGGYKGSKEAEKKLVK